MIEVLAFSREGAKLASLIASETKGRAWAPEKFASDEVLAIEPSLAEWTKAHFASEALVFVSACGIAVRTIAPFIKSKTEDPAVVVLDEAGKNVISLLSGHIGGANELARRIAGITGGNAVVTTATDVRNLTAVDEWAVKNNCSIENIKAAKDVSSEILDGHRVGVAVTDLLQPAPWPVTLWLRPKNLVLGIGCKKNTDFELLKESASDFLKNAGVSPLSLSALASIDLKKDEKAIKELAEEYGVPFVTYKAEELAELEGNFSSSEKVKSVAGVDNVCERAAVLKAEGPLLRSKTLYKGITFALAKNGRTLP